MSKKIEKCLKNWPDAHGIPEYSADLVKLLKDYGKTIKAEIETKLLESKPVINVQGNKGANYVKITQLDERMLQLEVGDCCIKTIDCTLSAEALSSFLTNIHINQNKEFLDVVRENMRWSKDINDELFRGSKNN